MNDLPAIHIHRDELRNKQKKIQIGNSLDEVIYILGGSGYKIESHGETVTVFWRFRILDIDDKRNQYEIYMGKFEGGKLKFGAFIPHGNKL